MWAPFCPAHWYLVDRFRLRPIRPANKTEQFSCGVSGLQEAVETDLARIRAGTTPGNPAAPQLSSGYKGLVDAAALRMKLRCATPYRLPSRCGCQRNTHSHDSDGKTVSVADVAADFQPEPGASGGAHRPLIPSPDEGPCEQAEKCVRNGLQGVCFALRCLSARHRWICLHVRNGAVTRRFRSVCSCRESCQSYLLPVSIFVGKLVIDSSSIIFVISKS